MKILTFIMSVTILSCGEGVVSKHGIRIINNTVYEIEMEQIEFLTETLISQLGVKKDIFDGVEAIFDEKVYTPTPSGKRGAEVGGWAQRDYIEVAYSGTCLPSTAFGHELIHVYQKRTFNIADYNHDICVGDWIQIDYAVDSEGGCWRKRNLGHEGSVKIIGGIKYCGYKEDMVTDPNGASFIPVAVQVCE